MRSRILGILVVGACCAFAIPTLLRLVVVMMVVVVPRSSARAVSSIFCNVPVVGADCILLWDDFLLLELKYATRIILFFFFLCRIRYQYVAVTSPTRKEVIDHAARYYGNSYRTYPEGALFLSVIVTCKRGRSEATGGTIPLG